MTTNSDTEFEATERTASPMFEILEATHDGVVAVRMGRGTPAGYREFYGLLVEKTDEYGTVHVYEETTEWTMGTYLSHLHGIVPDLRIGPDFDIGRYAAVGDSRWAKFLYHQWRAIAPVWPVAPEEMRYYELQERRRALDWVTADTANPDGKLSPN
jgi:hypothetical protein